MFDFQPLPARNRKAFYAWLALAGVVVALDQITKFLASTMLPFNEPVAIMPSLNLTLLHNTGAAFSLLSDAGGWQRWLFAGLAIVVSVVVIVWIRTLAGRQWLLPLALTFIVGGAVGNLWDRLAYGYVVDFIQVYYSQWYWPAFNVADSAISVGAALLIFDALRSRPEQE